MPNPRAINPRTGKRYDFVDPHVEKLQREADERARERELEALLRLQRARECQRDLLKFTQFTMPDPEAPNDINRSTYEPAGFHKAIAAALTDFVDGKLAFDDGRPCTQLIFCMPPRHGKTALATKSMAAWYSGRFPAHDVAVASYSDTMANDFGADTRFIMLAKPFQQVFSKHKLRRGGSAKDNIQTVVGGRLVYVGRGGALTGRGANLLLIDDIFKDFEEARSQAIRDQAWNWFTKVAMTRRMGRKLVLVTMTRWHSDDIIGRLTDPENPNYNAVEAQNWKIIRLPAIAEDDDPLGREPGEPLWPERYDLDFLLSQQRLDPLGFAALYQQRPTVADGVLFRRETIQYYDKLPENLRFYASSDHAVGETQRNDPSCLLKVGVDAQDNIYVIDCDWRRMATDVAVEAMLAMGGGNMRPMLWWAERGHISKSIGPFLRKRMLETGTYINLVEVTPSSDKVQRAQSIAARTAMGKVYFPRNAVWTERAINELLAFPNGNHDDFCLAGRTKITMADGSQECIVDVRAGDWVLTRKGPRKVIAAAMTNPEAVVYSVELGDGRLLHATAGHPVFVVGKGFVRVDALAYGDVLFGERQVSPWRTMNWSYIVEIGIGAIRKVRDGITEHISTLQSLGVDFCTGIFGKTSAGSFRKASISITGTKTRSTTPSTIWSASRYDSTAGTICVNEAERPSTLRISRKFANLLRLGTLVQRAASGIGGMVKSLGKVERKLKPCVNAAARRGSRMSRAAYGSATKTAVRVTSVEVLTQRTAVYNLTVGGENEFFAEGVLTHNCDALAYIGLGLESQFGRKTPAKQKQPEYGTLAYLKANDRAIKDRAAAAHRGGF